MMNERVVSDDDDINIDEKIKHIRSFVIDKQRGVTSNVNKLKLMKSVL